MVYGLRNITIFGPKENIPLNVSKFPSSSNILCTKWYSWNYSSCLLFPDLSTLPSHDALMLCLSSYKNYLWPKCDLLNQNTYSWNQSSSMLMQVETLIIFQSHVEYSKAETEGKELTLINIWSSKIKATVKLILQDN